MSFVCGVFISSLAFYLHPLFYQEGGKKDASKQAKGKDLNVKLKRRYRSLWFGGHRSLEERVQGREAHESLMKTEHMAGRSHESLMNTEHKAGRPHESLMKTEHTAECQMNH